MTARTLEARFHIGPSQEDHWAEVRYRGIPFHSYHLPGLLPFLVEVCGSTARALDGWIEETWPGQPQSKK